MRKKLKGLVEEISKIIGKAKEGKRGLSKEEQESCDKAEKEMDSLEKDIGIAERQIDREKKFKEPTKKPIELAEPGTSTEEKKFKTLGEQLRAVMNASDPAIRKIDSRLETRDVPSGLNEGVGDEGGFLVQTDFSTELLKKVFETGILASRVRKFPVGANSNGMTINALKDNSRATGSRYGGIQVYWATEADTVTAKKPAFRQMELKLSKLMGICYLTDEVVKDTIALEAIVTQGFIDEFGFVIDNSIWNGSGAGQPKGILNGGSYIEVTRGTTLTVVMADVVGMYARMYAKSRPNAVWFINQSIEPQLYTMTVGSYTAAFLPPGGLSAAPYASLFGRPIIPIEQTSALGTTGDIVFADLSQYMMIDKGGINTAESLHVRFLYDEKVFRFTYRVDGQPIWNAPLTPFAGSTLSPFVGLSTV